MLCAWRLSAIKRAIQYVFFYVRIGISDRHALLFEVVATTRYLIVILYLAECCTRMARTPWAWEESHSKTHNGAQMSNHNCSRPCARGDLVSELTCKCTTHNLLRQGSAITKLCHRERELSPSCQPPSISTNQLQLCSGCLSAHSNPPFQSVPPLCHKIPATASKISAS